MKLKNYTTPELEVFRTQCNFTADEMQYFNLKSRDMSNIAISLEMSISTRQVSNLATRVKEKISRIEELNI